jgi:hypothetical protein
MSGAIVYFTLFRDVSYEENLVLTKTSVTKYFLQTPSIKFLTVIQVGHSKVVFHTFEKKYKNFSVRNKNEVEEENCPILLECQHFVMEGKCGFYSLIIHI